MKFQKMTNKSSRRRIKVE
uniref:Uncharacterized protein n=1 Tax=Romanomermis culicivorax TaxID=13658 RepID=A0A915JKG7_ROMCU